MVGTRKNALVFKFPTHSVPKVTRQGDRMSGTFMPLNSFFQDHPVSLNIVQGLYDLGQMF